MHFTLHSSRFGPVDIPRSAIIDFPHGLIGLPGKRYALVPSDRDPRYHWLHGLDRHDVSIPVIDPFAFFEDYLLSLSATDLQRIGTAKVDPATVFATVRVDGGQQQFCANLRAPIVVSDGRGYQVLNHARGASLRTPIAAPAPVGSRAA